VCVCVFVCVCVCGATQQNKEEQTKVEKLVFILNFKATNRELFQVGPIL